MTRQEAFEALKAGKKITHYYFAEGEYYKMEDEMIIAEDGVDHSDMFWDLSGQNWRKDGWEEIHEKVIYSQAMHTRTNIVNKGKSLGWYGNWHYQNSI